MAKKKRTYNTRLIKNNYSYDIVEICELFNIHKSSVRNWIKLGLGIIDEKRPLLIHGSDLIKFINERQSGRKFKCQPNEFYCLKCRVPRRSINNKISIKITSIKLLQLLGTCSTCKCRMFRSGSAAKIEIYQTLFEVQKTDGMDIIERTQLPLI